MKKEIISILIILILISTGLTSATKISNKEISKTTNTSTGEKYWTIMVYIAGDTYNEFASENIIDWIEKSKFSENINVIIQIDSMTLFEGSKRYEIIKDEEEAKANLVNKIEETNTGKISTLTDFITWGYSNYPAEKYCILLHGHGAGWRHAFLRDETDDDFLTMQELKETMNQIKNNLNKKIDLLILDACLMGMVEVYYQLRESIKVCVAAPNLIPAWNSGSNPRGGCPMHMVLPDLYKKPDSTKEKLAEYFVEGYNDYYNSQVDAGAFNIEKISNNLVEKIDVFAETLVNNYKEVKDEIKFSIDKSAAYNAPDPDGGDYVTHYKDLYNFAHRIYQEVKDTSIKSKAEDVLDAILDCEIYPKNSLGISIYIPTKNYEYRYDSSYEYIDICKDTAWKDLVLKTKEMKNKAFLKIFIENYNINIFLKNIFEIITN